MNFAAAWLTLKHHRFEVGVCLIASLALTVAGIWLNGRLLAFDVPQDCFDAYAATLGESSVSCDAAVRAFAEFLFDNTAWFDPAMFVLPLAAGTIVGVPIVGRELESRTAQTAWYLSPSRSAWLVRQLWPVLLVVGAAVTAAAMSAWMLHTTRVNAFPPGVFEGLGFYGPLVVARTLMAFGVGLLAGALVGRSLPAWVVAAIACGVLLIVGISARQAWLGLQSGEIIEQTETNSFVRIEDMYRAPDGDLLSEEQAFALVPPESAGDAGTWLSNAGYVGVYRGIREITTRAWEPIETAGTALAGVALVAATFTTVDRRRPT